MVRRNPSHVPKEVVEITEEDKKALGYQIGLDISSQRDRDKYGWILEMLITSSLPAGWEKERDIDGELVFYNRIKNKTTSMHPNHLEFRKILLNLVS